MPIGAAILEARDIHAGYGKMPVLRGLSLQVARGEVVALIGPNGAGKTTTMLTLAGELPLASGEILFHGRSARFPLFKKARQGLSFVTEERSIFRGLTAEENMRVGGCTAADAFTMFPNLFDRMSVLGGLLSGGEQQMLTLARALGRHPTLLLADELSLGLAPIIVEALLQKVRSAADAGMAVILVEQQIRKVLKYADRGYVLSGGTVVASGTGMELLNRIDELEKMYLGFGVASS